MLFTAFHYDFIAFHCFPLLFIAFHCFSSLFMSCSMLFFAFHCFSLLFIAFHCFSFPCFPCFPLLPLLSLAFSLSESCVLSDSLCILAIRLTLQSDRLVFPEIKRIAWHYKAIPFVFRLTANSLKRIVSSELRKRIHLNSLDNTKRSLSTGFAWQFA